jgi:hypothetical protein
LNQSQDRLISIVKLILAIAVWLLMGVLLSTGLLLAVNGRPWLLLAGVIGFIIAVGRIGCASH